MIEECPLCSQKEKTVIYSIEKMPIFQNKVYKNISLAKKSRTHDLSLVTCNNCNFTYNEEFISEIMEYDENYQNEQNYSIYFTEYLKSILHLFQNKFNVDSKIIEIGSGKGYFVDLLEKNNFNNVLGFDPAYEGSKKNIIKDYFSSKYNTINADLIILRHTLEHVLNPFSFLKEIAKANNYTGKVFIEVPCFEWIKEKEAFWDIFYEHCNYFTKETLRLMFKVSEVGDLFNSQYIYILADLKDLQGSIESSTKVQAPRLFHNSFNDYLNFIDSGKSCIWGAGAKGVTFLNILDPNKELIQYVVDINPKKQNQYIAQTGHEIIDIATLKKYIEKKVIHNVLIMNGNYKQEIMDELDSYHISFLILGEINE